MAKSLLRLKARKLRSQGKSVIKIAKSLRVSKSTVSLWVRDIILTVDQIKELKRREINGSELGRLRGAFIQKQRRLSTIDKYLRIGQTKISKLTKRELLIAGLALYWAEGAKKKNRVELCNSDPRMIQFTMLWLNKCFHITRDNLICWIGINESHAARDKIVRNYWSDITGIPIERFRNTSYKRVKTKKIYENHDQHFGTLYLSVAKSANLSYKVMGLINGLMTAGYGPVSWGVS